MVQKGPSDGAKPRRQLSSVYSQEDIKQIATLLDLSDLSRLPDLKKRLNNAAFSFQDVRKKVDKAPRRSEDRVSYSRVKECTDKLLAALTGLHENQNKTLNQVSHENMSGVDNGQGSSIASDSDRISVAKATLEDLLTSSKNVLENLPLADCQMRRGPFRHLTPLNRSVRRTQ